jgi:hypothetical protein
MFLLSGMATVKEVAEVYRLGVLTGFFDVADVVVWADFMIESEDHPDYGIIEASLSGSKRPEDISVHLKAVKGNIDFTVPPKILMGLMSKQLDRSPDQALKFAQILYSLAAGSELPQEEAEVADRFDDAIYLAKSGTYGSVEEVGRELAEFLKRYEPYASGITHET